MNASFESARNQIADEATELAVSWVCEQWERAAAEDSLNGWKRICRIMFGAQMATLWNFNLRRQDEAYTLFGDIAHLRALAAIDKETAA
jgi:hypothetical protein